MTRRKRTKKIGSSGKYGPRYGTKIRKRVKDIEEEQKKSHRCPNCMAKKVKRVSTGIWKCTRCDTKFSAKAYTPNIRKIEGKETEKIEESK
ncbi:MAG: 50S ribosomal protein L37ae [Hadesarchaea archaeon]|nr:50S ribosomal protein L37ae [Hadesarchaea archaeon]